jgi:hypothetical protein
LDGYEEGFDVEDSAVGESEKEEERMDLGFEIGSGCGIESAGSWKKSAAR